VKLSVFAPGRLCLCGEHQDYLGLEAVALAMNLGIRITGTRLPEQVLRIDLLDIGESRTLPLEDLAEPRHARDYLAAALQVLHSRGVRFTAGAHLSVQGDLPQNAGLGSSSTLVVAFLRALLKVADSCNPELKRPAQLAQMAYEAEVERFGESGGQLDHLCAAYGSSSAKDRLLHLSLGSVPVVVPIATNLPGLILIESGDPKDTTGVLHERRGRIEALLKRLRRKDRHFLLRNVSFDQAYLLLQQCNESGEELFAHLYLRDYTQAIVQELQRTPLRPGLLGDLFNSAHAQLRDGLQLSTPRIEELREIALGSGALGAKLTGSGGGGCLFAYAPDRQQPVLEALRRAGARAQDVRGSRAQHDRTS
jgi:galactokinase